MHPSGILSSNRHQHHDSGPILCTLFLPPHLHSHCRRCGVPPLRRPPHHPQRLLLCHAGWGTGCTGCRGNERGGPREPADPFCATAVGGPVVAAGGQGCRGDRPCSAEPGGDPDEYWVFQYDDEQELYEWEWGWLVAGVTSLQDWSLFGVVASTCYNSLKSLVIVFSKRIFCW